MRIQCKGEHAVEGGHLGEGTFRRRRWWHGVLEGVVEVEQKVQCVYGAFGGR